MSRISTLFNKLIKKKTPRELGAELLKKIRLRPYETKKCVRLIEAGADIEMTDKEGRTPLLWAAIYGNVLVVEALLAAGAKVDVKDNDHNTPLINAAWHGKDAVVEVLLNAKASINAENREGSTALIAAARYGRTQSARILIQAGADVEAKDYAGKDALALAQEKDHSDISAMLIIEKKKNQAERERLKQQEVSDFHKGTAHEIKVPSSPLKLKKPRS